MWVVAIVTPLAFALGAVTAQQTFVRSARFVAFADERLGLNTLGSKGERIAGGHAQRCRIDHQPISGRVVVAENDR